MNYIYIVNAGISGDWTRVAVFDSREKAEAFIAEIPARKDYQIEQEAVE